MGVQEFFDRLYALKRSGLNQEILDFSDAHVRGVMPRITDEEHMKLHGILEGALMTIDLEQGFGASSDSVAAELDVPSVLNDD